MTTTANAILEEQLQVAERMLHHLHRSWEAVQPDLLLPDTLERCRDFQARHILRVSGNGDP